MKTNSHRRGVYSQTAFEMKEKTAVSASTKSWTQQERQDNLLSRLNPKHRKSSRGFSEQREDATLLFTARTLISIANKLPHTRNRDLKENKDTAACLKEKGESHLFRCGDLLKAWGTTWNAKASSDQVRCEQAFRASDCLRQHSKLHSHPQRILANQPSATNDPFQPPAGNSWMAWFHMTHTHINAHPPRACICL